MSWTASLKTKIYRSAYVGWIWYDKAWRDDRKFTTEDIDETIYAAAAMLLIWPEVLAPVLTSPPAVAIEVIVVGGLVASVAIGGARGGELYIEYITSPEEWAPTVVEYIAEPVVEYVTEELWQRQLVEPITAWVNRRERDLQRTWEQFKPRAPTWL